MFTERGNVLFAAGNKLQSKYWGILKLQYRFSYAFTFSNVVKSLHPS